MSKRILLVEDEQEIADIVKLHLEDLNLDVTHAADGIRGLALALKDHWDLIMLDLTLPQVDGLTICQQVREFNPATPIILVTARTSEAERVSGLDSGADDYITKPFSITELIARVKAIFRRVDALRDTPKTGLITVNDIVVNPAARTVSVNGEQISLTSREFDLLRFFALAPERVFKRKELLEEVWGYHNTGYLHTVNSHINRLRAKIEKDPSNPKYIQTVWGVGYKLSNPIS